MAQVFNPGEPLIIRKRGPESPEARIARADRVAQEMTHEERESLFALLHDEDPGPEALCAAELEEAIDKRDAAIQTAKDDFAAAKARNGRRSAVAAIYSGLDPQYQARLLRQLRAISEES